MTPETLARINDLRRRIVEADALRRAGDPRASTLEPTSDEIIEALKAIRLDRASSMESKVAKVQKSSASKALSSIDINELFS